MSRKSKQTIEFDRNELKLRTLKERKHDLDILVVATPVSERKRVKDERFLQLAKRVVRAKERNASIIMMMGGHVIRSGVQKYVIDLMQRGYLSCIAMNGAGMIHDFEFALIGATTESVSEYIKRGQFGLWKETGRLNDFINEGFANGMGMGEVVGKAICEGAFPYRDISLLASCYKQGIPVTVHVGIGYDIIHEHPNCSGAATGETSYRDFLKFTRVVQNLEGGVVMNFGSAVMAPEVYLKALSMARNRAYQNGESINNFTVLVCDLHSLGSDYHKEPSKDNPNYYFRPWKTMLVRTVADGGDSLYIQGDHKESIPSLWRAINRVEKQKGI